jgi:outer membrane receptor protein involved in Fe transport
MSVQRQDGYLRVDVEARYPLISDLELNLFVRNLFDVNYQERFGFPAAGRNIGLAVRMRI